MNNNNNNKPGTRRITRKHGMADAANKTQSPAATTVEYTLRLQNIVEYSDVSQVWLPPLLTALGTTDCSEMTLSMEELGGWGRWRWQHVAQNKQQQPGKRTVAAVAAAESEPPKRLVELDENGMCYSVNLGPLDIATLKLTV